MEQKMINLFNFILINDEVKTSDLKELGFSKYEIGKLVEKSIIARVKIGHYKFISAEEFFNYGQELIKLGDEKQAFLCFEKCLQIDANYANANLQIFFVNVKKKNYDKAVLYLINYLNTANNIEQKDAKYYLLLISRLTKLPSKYQKMVNRLSIFEILIDNETEVKNKIRTYVFERMYFLALKQLESYLAEKENKNLQDAIESTLMYQIYAIIQKSRKEFKSLVKNGDYEKALILLNDLEKFSPDDSLYYNCTVLVLKELTKISKDYIPDIQKNNARTVYAAIENKDYARALELCKMNNANKEIKNNSSILYIVLEKIVQVIDESKRSRDDETRIHNIVDKRQAELNGNGAILLDSLSKDDYNRLSEYVATLTTVKLIPLNDDEPKMAFLKRNLSILNDEKLSKLIESTNALFYEGKFAPCISRYRKIICRDVSCDIYARLGICYMHARIANLAIMYLKIALALAKKEKMDEKYIEDIEGLLQYIPTSTFINREPSVDDFENYYGITVLPTIIELLKSGVSIKDACQQTNLDTRETMLVYLIIAREYYIIEDYAMGDAYLKAVRKMDNIPMQIAKKISAWENRKRFFKNERASHDSLVVGLKRIKPN